VAELMPRHPVYVNLLPERRAAIGEVHDDTQPARVLLEQEGFRYEGYVDIFDAGPTLECFATTSTQCAEPGASGRAGRGTPCLTA
jgi:arginine N-succinyltransferase